MHTLGGAGVTVVVVLAVMAMLVKVLNVPLLLAHMLLVQRKAASEAEAVAASESNVTARGGAHVGEEHRVLCPGRTQCRTSICTLDSCMLEMTWTSQSSVTH